MLKFKFKLKTKYYQEFNIKNNNFSILNFIKFIIDDNYNIYYFLYLSEVSNNKFV